jgi:hypothetical protein
VRHVALMCSLALALAGWQGRVHLGAPRSGAPVSPPGDHAGEAARTFEMYSRLRDLAYTDHPIDWMIALLLRNESRRKKPEGGQAPASPDRETALWKEAYRLQQAGDREGARAGLHAILSLPDLESRSALNAWRALRDLGEKPEPQVARQVLGVVFEIVDNQGPKPFLATAAAFARGSPRYFASTGAAVIGEGMPEEVENLGKELLAAGAPFVHRFKPELEHKLPQGRDKLRFALLTPAGVLVAESTFDKVEEAGLGAFALAGDRLIAGLLLDAAARGREVRPP